VPLGTGTLSYRRRVESPLHHAGYVLVEALRAQRIQVPERVALRRTPANASLLASHVSPPLAQVLFALGKQSDNFVAEMALKVLGAERVRQPGTSGDGAHTAVDTLKRLGIATANIRMVNGSGLFRGNAIAAVHLARLLEAMHRDTALRPEFLAHLAIAGVDGTLAERLKGLPAPRIVRAKTGTLADVAALSGYVLGPTPEPGMAFSVIANDVGGKVHAARELADHIVEAIVAQLYPTGTARPERVSPSPRGDGEQRRGAD
jgi:D-alanyl-D-alanine carboxypeptidase/D-alanyl-D-alanine-endopeptidase (penicillin-binding protein 4)